jgi:hypothetical protein
MTKINLTILISTSVGISICSFGLLTPAQAQTTPTTPAPVSNDWKDYPNIEKSFIQGCMGKNTLTEDQKKARQNFCQCIFTTYKTRYTPQVFGQVNTLATKIGANGPVLANLMLKPEIDICVSKSNLRP